MNPNTHKLQQTESLKIMILHIALLFIFIVLFFFLFSRGFLLYGDFATTFMPNNTSYVKNHSTTWLNNSFLGYDGSFYTILRLPFYIVNDAVNFIFGFQYWWLIIAGLYFLRYFLFFELLRYLKVKQDIAIFTSLIYTLNFYFIDRLGHFYIFFASTFVPLFVLCCLKLNKQINGKILATFILSTWIILSSLHVTLMTIYFTLLFFIFQLITLKEKKTFLFNALKVGTIFLFIFAYIALPMAYNVFFKPSQNVISQVKKQAENQIYAYSGSTVLPLPLIGLGFYASELLQSKIIIVLAIIILISILVLILKKEKKDGPLFSFFLLTFFIFGSLSSISIIKPIIPKLKSYLIGFGAIKDTGYFIFFVIFSLFIILALAAGTLKNQRMVKMYLSIILLFFVGMNIFAFSRLKVFQRLDIPSSYYTIMPHLKKEKRALILPLGWVSQFDWTKNVILSGFFNLFFSGYEIVGQTIIEGPAMKTQQKINTLNNCITNDCADLKNFIQEIGIYSIINFKNAKDTLRPDNYLNYDKTLETLEKKKYFQKKVSTPYYDVYELTDPSLMTPKIFGEGISFKKISTTEYRIYLEHLSDNKTLTFLESFNPDWKLKLKKKPNKLWCITKNTFENIKTIECQQTSKKGLNMHALYPGNQPNREHALYREYANQWTIDAKSITQSFSEDSFIKNPDGSIDIELVLYYAPETYYTLGKIISAISLIAICIIIIVQTVIEKWSKYRIKKTTKLISSP